MIDFIIKNKKILIFKILYPLHAQGIS